MHITVVGTGYVGLVTGAGLADFGLDVTCVDSDEAKINMLQQGRMPIYEIGLEEIVRRNVANKRLHFSSDVVSAVKQSLVVFIAVGTPSAQDGSADLSYVLEAAKQIGAALTHFTRCRYAF